MDLTALTAPPDRKAPQARTSPRTQRARRQTAPFTTTNRPTSLFLIRPPATCFSRTRPLRQIGPQASPSDEARKVPQDLLAPLAPKAPQGLPDQLAPQAPLATPAQLDPKAPLAQTEPTAHKAPPVRKARQAPLDLKVLRDRKARPAHKAPQGWQILLAFRVR